MLIVQTSAKINLGLEIISKRDDGYHNISSVLQSVNMFDEISLQFSDNLTFSSNVESLNNESNLVMGAVRAFEDHTGIIVSLNIVLDKHIPIGMGLGGGSGNAAGVLYALNEIYSTGLSNKELHILSSSLGADVPFFLQGGTAVVGGIGDIITPLDNVSEDNLVLICPKICLSNKTKSFFDKICSEDITDGSGIQKLCTDLLELNTFPSRLPDNVFSRILNDQFPQLLELRKLIQDELGTIMNITGTGLGMFAVTEEWKALKHLVDSQYYDMYKMKTTDRAIEMRSNI